MSELVKRGRRGGSTASCVVDSEPMIYLECEPLLTLVDEMFSMYGEDLTKKIIRDAMTSLCERSGRKLNYSKYYHVFKMLALRRRIELDIVDAIYIAFNRPDLFRYDYQELYEFENGSRTNV